MKYQTVKVSERLPEKMGCTISKSIFCIDDLDNLRFCYYDFDEDRWHDLINGYRYNIKYWLEPTEEQTPTTTVDNVEASSDTYVEPEVNSVEGICVKGFKLGHTCPFNYMNCIGCQHSKQPEVKKCMSCEKTVEYSSGIFTCEECSGDFKPNSEAEKATHLEKNKIIKRLVKVIRDYIKDDELISEIETDLVWLSEFEAIHSSQQKTTPMAAEEIIHDLAKWSNKYPRGKVYGMYNKDKMDGELIEIENRAKQFASSHVENKSLGKNFSKTTPSQYSKNRDSFNPNQSKPTIEEKVMEEMYSRKQLEELQTKVYELVGKGKIMQLFNELLGVNQG